MRIVLDTNVVLSALLWRGTPYHLLQAIREREGIRLFSSARLLEELAEVLARPSLAKRLARLRITARQVLADYAETADIVTPIATPRIVADDRDDDALAAIPVGP